MEKSPAENKTAPDNNPELPKVFRRPYDLSYFIDFLRFSIRRSIESAELYESIERMVNAAEIKSFLKDMVDLKRYEAERLQHYHRLVGSKAYDSHPNVSPSTKPKIKADLYSLTTMEAICRLALSHESGDLQLYLRLADLEEDAATKRLFRFLVHFQKAHCRFVRNQMALAELSSAGSDISATAVKQSV